MSRITKNRKKKTAEKALLNKLEVIKFEQAVRDLPPDHNPFEPFTTAYGHTFDTSLKGRLNYRVSEPPYEYLVRMWGIYPAKKIHTAFLEAVEHLANPQDEIDHVRFCLVGNPESEAVYEILAKSYVWHNQLQHDFEIVVRDLGTIRIGFNYAPKVNQ